LLSDRVEDLPAGRTRTLARLLLGEGSELAVEEEQLDTALVESAGDPELDARVLARRAALLAVNRVERLDQAEVFAEEALAAAGQAGGEVEHRAAVSLAWARVMRGHPIDDLEARYPSEPIGLSSYDSLVDRPRAVRSAFRGELQEARTLCRRLLELAEERGEARSGVLFHHHLCEFELRAGRVTAAASLVEEWEHWTALEEFHQELTIVRQRLRAVLAALKGDAEEAGRLAASVLDACDQSPGLGWDRLEAHRARGLAALVVPDLGRAVDSLQFVWSWMERERVDDPGAFPVAGDLAEALVEVGDLAGAREVIARLEALATSQDHPWGTAAGRRSRALIALAEGSGGDEPLRALGEVAAVYCELGLCFDHARTLLSLGLAERRLRKRSAARRSLEQAVVAFTELGCTGWAERASSELARVSGRRPAEAGELTPSERRVSELAASGMSNKEIAAVLFVSVYTVEAHLSSAYGKLGVRSRTQLAARL
jgi:DNA-binding CsgD family transcriptional regulator